MDLVMKYGPLIKGAHPEKCVQAVRDALGKNLAFGVHHRRLTKNYVLHFPHCNKDEGEKIDKSLGKALGADVHSEQTHGHHMVVLTSHEYVALGGTLMEDEIIHNPYGAREDRRLEPLTPSARRDDPDSIIRQRSMEIVDLLGPRAHSTSNALLMQLPEGSPYSNGMDLLNAAASRLARTELEHGACLGDNASIAVEDAVVNTMGSIVTKALEPSRRR